MPVAEVAPVAPALDITNDVRDEFCDMLLPIDDDIFDVDIACAWQPSSPEGSDFSSDDFSDVSDSLDEYDDCWDAYEQGFARCES